jgi:hypothetical protein
MAKMPRGLAALLRSREIPLRKIPLMFFSAVK